LFKRAKYLKYTSIFFSSLIIFHFFLHLVISAAQVFCPSLPVCATVGPRCPSPLHPSAVGPHYRTPPLRASPCPRRHRAPLLACAAWSRCKLRESGNAWSLQEKGSTWAKGIGVHRAKELVEAAFFSFSISRKPQYDFREFIDEDVFRYSFW
jgi:hypothetical protein